jgi:leucyl-tRNA synthetase
MPVDLYLGGAEHTVGHLLYSRFWQKVLFDVGLVSCDEPFKKLYHQGLILGPDGEKMSKSRGNVVNPDIVREEHGADATRLYICFMGPTDKDKPWSSTGIDGVRRFLERVWRLAIAENGNSIATDTPAHPEIEKLLHKTIKKVTEDIENLSYNTCISQMMILVNEMYKVSDHSRSTLLTLTQLLMPFGPHVAEELWENLGGQGFVSLAKWPTFNLALCKDDTVVMGVQINGKMRGTIEISMDTTEAAAIELAQKVPSILAVLDGKPIAKVIYKAGKILNLILK